MKPKTLVVAGAIIVVTAIVVVGILKPSFFGFGGGSLIDDEAPIYVKNGSLDISSGDPDDTSATHWSWEEDSNKTEFRHKNPKGDQGRTDDFYVKVLTSQTGACTDTMPLSGKNVDIEYVSGEGTDETTFTAKLQRKGGGGSMSTRVMPHTDLAPDNTGWRLKHGGASSATEHIRGLRVSGGGQPSSCTFAYEPGLKIIVCASKDTADCK